jgi:hypothetical protein
MIHYPMTEQELREQIEAHCPGWLQRAQERTERFVARGKYDEASSIWSEVKPVYMRIQFDKCIYCERQLASPGLGGTIEHDLEHFRPKNAVVAWPTTEMQQSRNIVFDLPLGHAYPSGYYWLAYHVLNYAAACKKCNTPLKLNFFPIAGRRGRRISEPRDLQSEKPYLIYPLGEWDDDPEDLIGFLGIVPVPKMGRGFGRERAEVTIRFFELNPEDDGREELGRERARQLIALDNALSVLELAPSEARKRTALADIARLQRSSSPHANCVRSAVTLYKMDPQQAGALFTAARAYLDSHSP